MSDLLEELKKGIEARGFVSNLDSVILTKIYGEEVKEGNEIHTLRFRYLSCSAVATLTGEERKQYGFDPSLEPKETFLAELGKIIGYEKNKLSNQFIKLELESLRQNVPDTPQLDRLLRYETSLERTIDRTLNQLERRQRMRLGRPAPPSINLNITS